MFFIIKIISIILFSEQGMEWYKPRSLGNLTVDLDTLSIWSGGQKYNDRYFNMETLSI